MSKETMDMKEQLLPLSGRNRDHFLSALYRSERSMPEAIRKAKARKAALVVSDVDEKPENGQEHT